MSKKSSRRLEQRSPKQAQQTATPSSIVSTPSAPSGRQPRRVRERVVVKHESVKIGWVFGVITVLLIAIAAIGLWVVHRPNTSTQASGTSVNTLVHPTVDNISCTQATPAPTLHAHLTIYIKNTKTTIPQNIGIPTDGTCTYWLHTQDTSGVLDIQVAQKQSYTLGAFIDLWSEQFPQLQYPLELSQSEGWQAWVNGKPYTGDFRHIPLSSHAIITLAYNSPGVKPDLTYKFPAGD